jgi:hypothetical protein
MLHHMATPSNAGETRLWTTRPLGIQVISAVRLAAFKWTVDR